MSINADFPSNSHKSKVEPEAEPKREKLAPVVSQPVSKRKKPLGKRIGETIAGDDMHTVGQYILMDVLLPAFKNTISDVVTQGIERALFGDSARTRSQVQHRPASHQQYAPRTQYNRPTTTASARPVMGGGPSISQRGRATHDFDEIVFPSRGDAEIVLQELLGHIEKYQVATVHDFYDLVEISTDFTNVKWGWYNLNGVSVSRVSGGYLLNLPQPIELS